MFVSMIVIETCSWVSSAGMVITGLLRGTLSGGGNISETKARMVDVFPTFSLRIHTQKGTRPHQA